MICPVCNNLMIVVERNLIELDYCPNCQGAWFDEGELSLLAEAMGLQEKVAVLEAYSCAISKEKPYKCPRCHKKMQKVHLEADDNVLLDRCVNNHGLWFDKGEVEQVLGSAAGNHSPVASYIRNVFKE
jgi:uncharacterized protein